jgi:hypothetical protein
VTDQMSPADVPAEYVRAALDGIAAFDPLFGEGNYLGYNESIRATLAAVLPIHEQLVRGRVASELRAVIFHCPAHDAGFKPTFDHGCIGCQRHAALVGAAQLVAGHESPSVTAVREMRQVRKDD